VVDLVEWTAFGHELRPVDPATDVRVIAARRWPLHLTPPQFRQVTGATRDSDLDYYCNNWVHYQWRGVDVQLEIVWNWEASSGAGDVYEALFRGSRASAEIRQDAAGKYIPELYLSGIAEAALRAKIEQLRARWPGLQLVESGSEWRIGIPSEFRVGHEAHFAQVANQFFRYAQGRESMPAWECPLMLAKYAVTTGGVDLGKRS
jgi:Putative oxidoreductase C terminal domain